MAKTAPDGVPVFKLYGETAAWPTPDLLHCESIPERSALHEWEIRPHRHGDLLQLLYVQSGTAQLRVEDQLSDVDTPTLQVVPALSVHHFKFSPEIQGHVLSLAQPLVQQLAQALEMLLPMEAVCYAAGDDESYLSGLFRGISDEYRQRRPGRELMLQSQINLLMVWLCRKGHEVSGAHTQAHDRGREHLQAFMERLELHYCEHWPIARYADELGLSAAHLNALCRRLAGQSALQMINARLLLEAKRCLIYTYMTVNQVSDSLGFSEPAYFSRFFKRSSGQSPKEFRLAR